MGMKLRQLVPGLRKVRKTCEVSPGAMKRAWCYLLPG